MTLYYSGPEPVPGLSVRHSHVVSSTNGYGRVIIRSLNLKVTRNTLSCYCGGMNIDTITAAMGTFCYFKIYYNDNCTNLACCVGFLVCSNDVILHASIVNTAGTNGCVLIAPHEFHCDRLSQRFETKLPAFSLLSKNCVLKFDLRRTKGIIVNLHSGSIIGFQE